MRRREARVAFVAALCVLGALLSVFAIELSNTQAKSKRDVKTRVHERAVLAAALIDSLFQTVGQQIPQDERIYGAPVVDRATMERRLGGNPYGALLTPSGRLLASTRGFTPEARAHLAASQALGGLGPRHPYELGNAEPYGSGRAIDFAVYLQTTSGPRILVTGFRPAVLSTFIKGELRKIPGVRGAHNYLLDGTDTILASTNPKLGAGYVFNQPAAVRALAQPSGDQQGRYYDQVRLSNSTWRVVLAAPVGRLFASVSGLRKWVPWMIFLAFAFVALAAVGLALRLLRRTEEVRVANGQLELVNQELAGTNAALERRAAELARSNAELDQFASIASHDLQEPLRKVRTFTQQLTVMEADQLSDKGRDYLLRANAAAERMQKLIEDLLRYSRVATHGRPFVDVDLGQVVHEVLDDLGEQVTRSGGVIHVGALPTVRADAMQMRQLFQNLVSNALKFARADVAPEIWIGATVDTDEVRLTVRDNGIGFDPRYERRIFRVFERLHGRQEYPGTGIGLALCRKIVERHAGTILADGLPDEGATFTVMLPLHLEAEVIVPRGPAEQDHGADGEAAETEAEEAHVVA